MDLVRSNTPWERYEIEDQWPVWVKREDLCCDPPGPTFSKIRGVHSYLTKLIKERGKVPIGVLDTYHSKAGRGVAWICNQMGLECHVYYPVYKKEWIDANTHFIREHQEVAADLGATLEPLDAGRSAILYHAAKKHMESLGGVMLPNGLKLAESVEATAHELVKYTPEKLCYGTWVVSISSGTIAAGVLRGLYYTAPYAMMIAHMGYSRSEKSAREYMYNMSVGKHHDVLEIPLRIIDEGYAYKDKVDNDWIPFPCNEYYDAKAFTWLADHIDGLKQPVVFWNIGA